MIRPTSPSNPASHLASTAGAAGRPEAREEADQFRAGGREAVQDPRHAARSGRKGWKEWKGGLEELKSDLERQAALGVGVQAGFSTQALNDALSDKTPTTDLGVIARRVMADKGLQFQMPAEAVRQAAAVKEAPRPDHPGIRDMRSEPWVSIDNGTLDPKTLELVNSSQDLDQLSMATRLPDGSIRVRVAIADVDSLVPKGSPIDRYAMGNSATVYTDGGIFPMIPREFSEELTSLDPGVDRLAQVKEFTVHPDGSRTDETLYQAWVHNHAKMAYIPVSEWMDGSGPTPPPLENPTIVEQVRLQDEAAQWLKAGRFEEGAVAMESRETKAKMNERGDVLALERQQPNRASEIIENLMIAANQVTSNFLEAHGMPSLRRVVKSPEKWDRIVAVAKEKGVNLPRNPDSKALNEFLVAQKKADPLHFPDLSLTIVKLIGRGEYIVEKPGEEATGHFCLAVSGYNHSTAPNRRAPDLVGQRMEKAALRGEPCPYTDKELEDLAAHFTQQEDAIKKVERQVSKSAAAKLLAPHLGETFQGLVTGAGPKGTWVRILEPPVEGKLVKGVRGLEVGDRVDVTLLKVDVEKGHIDFQAER